MSDNLPAAMLLDGKRARIRTPNLMLSFSTELLLVGLEQ